MTTLSLTPGKARLADWRHVIDGATVALTETGTLETGKACDLAIWEIERPAELAYRIGFNPLYARIRNGQ